MGKHLTDEQNIEIVNLYKNGLDSVEIGKLFNRTPPAIRSILKHRNVERNRNRAHNKKYSYNESYFDKIDSEDKAYFLGFLFADGCNKTNRGTVTLFLKKEDKKILMKLNELISHDKPLSFEKGSGNRDDMYGIRIHNFNISKKLELLGVVRAKTFKITFPEWLDESLHNHFVRGYFDGDGSISSLITSKGYTKDRATITGTDLICGRFAEIFKKLGVHSSIEIRHPKRNNNIITISISGRLQLIKIMNYLYKDSTLFLERKKNIFLNLKNRYEQK